jgi:hypothetical protein
MTTMRGPGQYAGLLPVPIRPATLENNPFPNGQQSLRKRLLRALSRFLIAFCIGVAATLAWWSFSDAPRQMIANSYPVLGWLAPPAEPVAQGAPNMIALPAPATPSFDQQQLRAMSLNFDALRQSIERIAAGQEQIVRSIDQIATTIAAVQEQITRDTGQTATSIATGQEQIAPSIDQTATSIAQVPSARASGITVESRADGASPEPTVRLNTKPTEARPPQTLSKQLSTASGHDSSCLPSASAVLQNHPGGWPSWTLKAPGHEGTKCWYAATRTSESDQRRDVANERDSRNKQNGLSAPPAPYVRAPE